jgi:hypothetical protein
MKDLPISKIIHRGIRSLAGLQQKDGSFLSYSSDNPQIFQTTKAYQTTFLNSFILMLLCQLSTTKEIDSLKKNVANFLLSQKSSDWSWNYWARNSHESKTSPYPDDLDDTFCALAAIFHYDKKIISGEVLAKVVSILSATEKKEGGPYQTWLVSKKAGTAWKDIDLAVNSNVAYFLSLQNITLPNLQLFFENKIKKREFGSRYYPSVYTQLYFLSRFYSKSNKILVDLLFTLKKNEKWENPLNTALAILALLNLGAPLEQLTKSVRYLMSEQKNGTWDAYGFCLDPAKEKKAYYAGSNTLTTFFCLAALQKYFLERENKKIKRLTNKQEQYKTFLSSEITKNVNGYFLRFDKKIQEKNEYLLQRILKRDISQQIPLIAYYFFQALGTKHKKITKKILIKLGTINVFGWIAYTIYDDFLDNEGDPSLIPLATICLRQVVLLYSSFPQKNIRQLFDTGLNTIDEANMWEMVSRQKDNVVYKNLDQLAQKSLGHILGPLTIILLLGFSEKSAEYKKTFAFFKNYVIVKQLNDDAHDWETDLKKGQITPVVAMILKKSKNKKNIKKLKEIFWYEVINDVCNLIFYHAKKARSALKTSGIIVDATKLESFLTIYENSAQKALDERNKMIAFLKTYNNEV